MKKFRIMIECDVELTVAQLWPDGDAPENPTDDDVLELIEECGGVERVLGDWNLDESLTLDVREVKR
jgi:hypothetical protein